MQKVKDPKVTAIFSKNLAAVMKDKKMTAYKLAKSLEMTEPAVTTYLTGKTLPSLSSLVRLADTLNVTTDLLLGRTKKEKNP